jgi:hypothetical protein
MDTGMGMDSQGLTRRIGGQAGGQEWVLDTGMWDRQLGMTKTKDTK